MAREYRVLAAVHPHFPLAPKPYLLCEDTSVIGSIFYVMDFVAGRVFWDQRLPGLGREERRAIFDGMNTAIADLHRIDPDAVGLGDFGRPGNYMGRQVSRWSKQYRASETEDLPAMNGLIEWLPANLPPEGEVRIVHGDYRLDNLIFHPDRPEIAAILDWELSTLGDPIADFAYHVMVWRVVPNLFRGLKGVDFASLGIPEEHEYVAAYCRRTGRASIAHWDFYMVYSLFRIAAILQGIAKRALEGTAANAHAVETGRKAKPLAEQAWALARSIGA
jgi:aminoglycoside phosphotransferase (APT) family kinase protein